MIYFFYGENSFEQRRAIQSLVASFSGTAEWIDGEELTLGQLPDILGGGTLFAEKRLIIVRSLSLNKSVWEALGEWVDRVSDDTTLVISEVKPDKRTKTYKSLQKAATTQEFSLWKEYDTRSALQWLLEEVKTRQMTMSREVAQRLVEKIGVDQWRLHQALEMLSPLDNITLDVVEQSIPRQTSESVFLLFETALKRDIKRLESLLTQLRLAEDPHMVFGLLTGQVYQLAALVYAGSLPPAQVAKDIGVSPYALKSLSGPARTVTKSALREWVTVFEQSDELLKSSGIDPWLAVERALFAVAVPPKS